MEQYTNHHNPYKAGKPLTSDDGFLGREDIIKEVRLLLESKQNNLIVLYGQRRIGKTSILHKLERYLPNPPFFTVNFDLLDKARTPISEVLYEIAIKCAQKAGIPFDSKDLFLSNPDAFHQHFLPVLFEKLGKEKRLVFLFDEFDVLDQTKEKLPPTAAAIAIHPYLRKLIDSHPDIYFIFVVGRRMEELGYEFLSTFKSSHNILVFVLEDKEAIELIKRGEKDGIVFDQATIEEILFVTRGHPYFIQLLCQEIFNRNLPDQNTGRLKITQKMVQDAIPAAIKNGASAFLWIWNGLPSAERIIFSVIAEETKPGQVLTEGDIANILRQAGIKMLVRELNIAPSNLVEWNMLEKAGDGYRFYFEIVRRWVEKNKKLEQVREELEKISPLAETLYDAAHRYHLENNADSALMRLEEALTSNPNHLKARLLKGKILHEQKEYKSAIDEYKQAFILDETETLHPLLKVMLEYGSFLESQGLDDDAEKIYSEIIQDIYENEETATNRKTIILIKRGEELKASGDLLAAYRIYQSAGANNKAEELIYEIATQAAICVDTSKLENAQKMYALLEQLQPDNDEWNRKRKEIAERIHLEKELTTSLDQANAFYGQGNYSDALEIIDRTEKTFPAQKIPEPLYLQIRDLRRSIQNSISNMEMVNKAYSSGDLKKAKFALENEVERNPSNLVAHEELQKINNLVSAINRAKGEFEEGNLTSAQKTITSALRSNPDNREARALQTSITKLLELFVTAETATKNKNYLAAKESLDRILDIQPLNAKALQLKKSVDTQINKAVNDRHPTFRIITTVAVISSCVTFVFTAFLSPSILQFLNPSDTTATITAGVSDQTVISSPSPAINIAETPIFTTEADQLFDSNRFIPISLASTLSLTDATASIKTATDNLQLTPGYHVLEGIPLEFLYEMFTQHEGSVDSSIELSIPINAQNPLAAYFLIQADYGYSRYSGKQAGKLIFNFENGQVYEYPLIMGVNIRDWTRGDFSFAVTTITSPDIFYEWYGTSPEGRTGGMDLLRVSIPEEYQSSRIDNLTVVDTSLETVGEINLGIRILATSIEIQDQTQGPWGYQIEKIPASGSSLAWELQKDDVLILTGGSFQYQNDVCAGDGAKICVLVIKATQDLTVDITDLVPENNWIGVSSTITSEQAIDSVTDEFWVAPNCGLGCSAALVYTYTDFTLDGISEIQNPNQ